MTAATSFHASPRRNRSRLVIVDTTDKRHDRLFTGFDLCFQPADTRIHVHDLGRKVTDLILDAGRVWHTCENSSTGASRVA